MEELEKALAVVTEYAAKTIAMAVARKDVMISRYYLVVRWWSSENANVYALLLLPSILWDDPHHGSLRIC